MRNVKYFVSIEFPNTLMERGFYDVQNLIKFYQSGKWKQGVNCVLKASRWLQILEGHNLKKQKV